MQIVLLGSGNIATIFGQRLAAGGHRILQVMSRNGAHAATLAATLGCAWTDTLDDLAPDAEVYILAVSDPAVYAAAAKLRLPGALVLHTAGAIAREVLAPISGRHGVLYPLQSIRKEVGIPALIPVLIDAATPEALEQVRVLADAISPLVRVASDEQRLRLHVGAVLVNNFPNYLYGLTEGYLREEGVDFSYLQPLLEETVRRLETYSPAEVMTGPAYRGDTATIELHQSLLEGHPELLQWYRLFTEKISAAYHP